MAEIDKNRITATEALRQTANWPEEIKLSFNLSASDIISTKSCQASYNCIAENEFPASRLILEATETSIIRNFERAIEGLNLFKAPGVKIALDDFGTGYSSMNYLHQLPVDRLTLYRSLMPEIHTNHRTRMLVAAIIRITENFGPGCVAERVETIEQQRALMKPGRTTIQGYLYSRPVSAEKFLETVNKYYKKTTFLPSCA